MKPARGKPDKTKARTKTASVAADDGDIKIKFSIAVVDRGHLTRDELKSLAKDAARRVADGLKDCPYTDWGAENTRVKI